jgi:hypothetical protein
MAYLSFYLHFDASVASNLHGSTLFPSVVVLLTLTPKIPQNTNMSAEKTTAAAPAATAEKQTEAPAPAAAPAKAAEAPKQAEVKADNK